MKYLLLILSLVALIGTATAATPPKQPAAKAKNVARWSCCKK